MQDTEVKDSGKLPSGWENSDWMTSSDGLKQMGPYPQGSDTLTFALVVSASCHVLCAVLMTVLLG